MNNRITSGFLAILLSLGLALGTAACGGGDSGGAAQPAAEQDDHEHGDDTHTHEPAAADTAGTYIDTTGADLFEEQEDGDDHEHSDSTHTHE